MFDLSQLAAHTAKELRDEEEDGDDVGAAAGAGARGSEPTTLGVRSVVACYARVAGTRCGTLLCVAADVLAPAYALVGLVLVALWIAVPRFFTVHAMDWFAWLLWAVHVATAVLLFVSRALARWRYVGSKADLPELRGFFGCLRALLHRNPFGSVLQGVVVLAVGAAMTAVALVGLLLVIAQCVYEDYPFAFDLKGVYAATFVFLSFSHCVVVVADALSLHTLDGTQGAALELAAIAAILATISLPILSVVFVFYLFACCEGDWVVEGR